MLIKRYTHYWNRVDCECPLHSAVEELHSANHFPSVTLGEGYSPIPGSAKLCLPSLFPQTLGKEFARCQKKALGKKNGHKRNGVDDPGATCRGCFAECRHSTKATALPSVTLGKLDEQ